MRRKLLAIFIALPVTAGLFLLGGANPVFTPPAVPPLPDTASNRPAEFTTEGTVIADDDDPLLSNPRQVTRAEPIPEKVQLASVRKKPVGRLTDKVAVIDNVTYPVVTYETLALPNDPLVNQWWVTQTKFDQAWEIPPGNTQTILAVIDTGFALKHEEFTNRWHTNTGEQGATISEGPSRLNCADRSLPLNANCNLIDDNGDTIIDNESGTVVYQNPSRRNCTDQLKPLNKDCNQLDDDNNGYIDDVTGWDFSNYDNSVQAGELNPNGTGTTHGTLVAGIAAATGGNGKGIAGADWETKILPIQALDDDSYGDTLSVGRSIYYAIAQGADVITISLGSDLSDAYVRGAVRAAVAAGIVVVAASGNDGCDCMVYPANYPETLAVGALNTSGQVASFSSYGANLDLLAPGVNMTSSLFQAANQTSAYASGVNGTSFATPMIGGMLTRLLSQQPAATPNQLIANLTENINRLSLSPSVSFDNRIGAGTLDALKTSQRALTAKSPVQLYSFDPVSSGNKLSPSEITNIDLVHHCEPGIVPTTAIFELAKNGTIFYTMSKVEQQKAIEQAYVSKLFAHACMQQPQDNPTTVRAINLFREFKGINPKF